MKTVEEKLREFKLNITKNTDEIIKKLYSIDTEYKRRSTLDELNDMLIYFNDRLNKYVK